MKYEDKQGRGADLLHEGEDNDVDADVEQQVGDRDPVLEEQACSGHIFTSSLFKS